MMASRNPRKLPYPSPLPTPCHGPLHDWPQWQWQLRQRLPPCPGRPLLDELMGMRTTSTAQVLQQRVRHLIRKHADSAMLAPPPPHPLRQHHLEGPPTSEAASTAPTAPSKSVSPHPRPSLDSPSRAFEQRGWRDSTFTLERRNTMSTIAGEGNANCRALF